MFQRTTAKIVMWLLFSFGGYCGAVSFGVSWVSPIAPASKAFVMSIPNHPLKTDNQRLAVLCLVMFSVYGGLYEFCGIVGCRLARALYTK
ncbi:hypothetical protein CTT30_06020 [Vibrio coralliilyticus]|nr:hypothetical protein CTT30_06020 [Vibrio coralliilyticus]